jgi:hypothetical protein
MLLISFALSLVTLLSYHLFLALSSNYPRFLLLFHSIDWILQLFCRDYYHPNSILWWISQAFILAIRKMSWMLDFLGLWNQYLEILGLEVLKNYRCLHWICPFIAFLDCLLVCHMHPLSLWFDLQAFPNIYGLRDLLCRMMIQCSTLNNLFDSYKQVFIQLLYW